MSWYTVFSDVQLTRTCMIRELDGVQDVALPSEEDERNSSSPVAWLSHHIEWMVIQLGDGIACNCNQHCNASVEPTTHLHGPPRRDCKKSKNVSPEKNKDSHDDWIQCISHLCIESTRFSCAGLML
jgi:hypothetical protein